ncbi:RagB/SusD family nutrient uptake outer membrane protein [Prevotella copri]|uniref:RagB/SusD family nutrient uptake outer membrane protein n=1 Tax=Segatella copri TaxID=165179 RepID=A0A646FWL1_9BACT|nr:RagB/SusD family nutrient uptake outer membrane protein [Segatella copri]MQN12183.1 RagB/SusD family nutrient uptake outer membrane protein [Segatella copri]MQN61152.1 RagB/SusD family nutrient uptake outer membrane protein [Segatella copri]MQP13493.1 RagB/SusD family nutrient uptake outer membrane protein [Segatella copri]
MKLNRLFISAGLFAMALTGCTDLDMSPNSQYTEDPSQNSGVDPMIVVEAKMADVYYHLAGTLGRRYMEAQCLASDEFTSLAFAGGYYDSGTYAHQALHCSSPNDASIGWYDDVTAGITKANTILEELGSGASAQMKAPARAIRAYYTWILMDNYGDTPILDKVQSEGSVVPRSSRKEVAEWIESELNDIIPALTDDVTENTYGKPTKWMAEALLAKLYINWPVYTAESVDQYDAATAANPKLDACIAACDDIINSGKFNLGSVDYLHKFSYDNGWKVEDFIYAIPYDAINRQGMQYARPRTFKDMKNLLPNVYGSTDKFTQSFGGNMVVTPEFAKLFSLDGDIRNLSILRGDVYVRDPKTLRPTTEPFMYKGNQVHFTENITLAKKDNTIEVGNDANAYQQGCHSIKWFTTPADYNNGRNQSNDLPIFRYADILLMKAEALTRQGSSGAKALFNQIRSYAGAPTIANEPTLQEIYDERGREFFDENWRRNDMIRFGHYEDEFFPHYKDFPDANFDKRHRIFPVPQNTINLNGWEQNPGY